MFWLKKLLLYSFAVFTVLYSYTTCQGFNSLLHKDIDANVTCGNPAEIYFRTQDGILHPRLRTPLVCDATDQKNAHPPAYMNDDNLGTFWQSKASIDKAEIRVDLNQEVYGYELFMTFGDYRRPEQIAFYKSTDYGVTYEPWHYLVSPPALEQCRDIFNMPVTYNPEKVDTVICQQYPNYFPLEYNETFAVDMNGRQRGDGSSASYYHTPKILSWMKITNLKIVFTGLYQKFDRLSTTWHHYTVREIGLLAKCNCHGYADGFNCPMDPVAKERKCRCQGNTCGLYCEQCCPAYNQYPWQPSDGAPWVWNGTATCKACNCHNHSDVCVYDQNIADQGLSLDTNDQYKGGGVCVDCKHNTDGINCETCKKYFYRPVNQSKISPDSCKECGCNVFGTLAHPNMTYLDCVRDDEDMKRHPGKMPGDCYCKQNVIGKTCDTCNDEFYHLTQDNIFGCRDCDCFLPGTVNRSNICEKDEYGQCPCKENTHSRSCIECKQGYYNLTNDNINGCEDCGCDPGASIPGSFCNNITGTCECLPHIYGKQCKSIETGCYYPELHYISAEKNIYEEATSNLSVILDIPKNGFFRIMIRYSLPISDEAQVNILILDSEDGSVINSTTNTFTKCSLACYHRLSSEFLYLNEGEVNVFVYSPHSDLKLNKVIAIPKEFYLDTVLGEIASSHFQFQCNIDDNDMRRGTALENFCLSNVFSLTIAYNGQPLNCSCNPIGSYNHSTCDQHGGQCYCKPGVTGRDCSQCLPQFYGFSPSGCSPCSCKGLDKQCNVVTGWCNCPINTALRTCEPCQCHGNSDQCMRSGECLNCQNNTTGFYCESCINGTYGNTSATDCKDCQCDGVGSLNEICDIHTGQCRCKTNVNGRDCSLCDENTYNMSRDGCMPCTCNIGGSRSLQCDDTGQCPCLDHVTGLKCTQCSLGYYGLPTKPCEACGCSPIGSVNGTVCSNDEVGMCACKPGVRGRTCDTCQTMYTNFSSAGCSRCSPCPRNLYHILINVIEKFLNVTMDVEKLQNFTEIDDYFDKTTSRVEIAKTLGDEYSLRISTSEQKSQDLVNSLSSEFNSFYGQITSQNTQLSDIIPFINNQTRSAQEKIFEIREKTRSSKNFTEDVHEFLEDIILNFVNLVESSTPKYNEAKLISQHLSNVDLTEDLLMVEKSLHTARNLSQFIGNISQEVISQDTLARSLQKSVDEAVMYLTETRSQRDETHENFVKKIRNIYERFLTASELVESIQATNEKSKDFIEKATAILESSNKILEETRDNMTEMITQRLKYLVTPVSGQLEISMLQYDFTESVFLMKILQARDLLARDIPSGLSDPYAIISIIPSWRGQTSQKSRIINETLSPVFPFYDIYRFNIKVEEIAQTKVLISLYDYDPDKNDDILGEVVIDLKEGDFFNRIITKWYTVQPKGTTQLDTGDFNADGIGLLDMNVLLKLQIDHIKSELTTAETMIEAAKGNVSNLQRVVHSLNGSLQVTVEHTKRPIEVLSIFDTVKKLINETMDNAEETKMTIDNLVNYLHERSAEIINNDFIIAYKATEDFYQASLLRNVSQSGYLEDAITSANETFRSVLPLWRLINQHLPDLQAKTTQFQDESLQEINIRKMISFASNVSHISMKEMERLSKECIQLSEDIDNMEIKIEEIISAYNNHSTYISEGIELITKADSKLNARSSPSEKVLAALPIKENFEQTRDGVSQRIAALEEKLSNMQNASRIFNFAMRFLGNGSTVYKPSQVFQLNSISDYVQFDFKTNSSRGGVIYVITSKTDLSKSLRVFVTGEKLCVSTDFGPGPHTLCHPSDVAIGKWFQVHFSRYREFHYLTLISEDGEYSTVNNKTTKGVYNADYNNDTTIYIGGLPSHVLPTVLSYYTFYEGILDNLRINSETIHLWQPYEKYGQMLYHMNRRFLKHPSSPVYAASFYGTGALWYKPGTFRLNSSTVEIKLEFRTLHKNGVLLDFINESDSSVLEMSLNNGQVMVIFQTELSQKITITSKKSSYDDGQWYNVSFLVSDKEVTLNITNTPSNVYDSNSIQLEDGSRIPNGVLLVIGGTRVSFAGDIKNLKLNDKSSLKNVTVKDLVGEQWIKDVGVSYEGIIQGDINPGYRFYGYLPYKGYGSFSVVDLQINVVKQLQFTFKTTEKNGVLVYGSLKNATSNKESRFFYIALWDGYLYISYQNDHFDNMVPFYYEERLLDDNVWQTVVLNYTNNGFKVYLNGETIHSGWFGNVHEDLTVSGVFYVGGIPPSVHIILPVPVYWSFQGDFMTFSINSNEKYLLSEHSEGVSIGGISSATIIPTLPPTMVPTAGPQCHSAPGRPSVSNDVNSVKFGATSFTYNTTEPSYLGFVLTNKQKNFFKSSTVITLELRALTKNGLVFYAANSETDPSSFISLEMIDGRLRYQFRSPTGQVTMETTKFYALNAVWYKIYLLRIFQFGAIVIPQTKEYHNNRHSNTASMITITTPFFIGGLPNNVTAPSIVHRNLSFVGCIRNVEISSAQEDVTLDMTTADLRGSYIGECYSSIEPGAYFNGQAWMTFYDVSISRDFSISFQFRTYQRSGVLLAFETSDNRGFILQQKSGKLVFNYTNVSTNIQLSWTPSSNTSHVSYIICQLDWYDVHITKQGTKVSMVINKKFEVTNIIPDDDDMKGILRLGHISESKLGFNASPFYGCLKNIRIDGMLLDISRPSLQKNTELSCPIVDSVIF